MSKLPNIDSIIGEVLAEAASTVKTASAEEPIENATGLGDALRKLASEIAVGKIEVTYDDLEEFKRQWLSN